MNPTQLKHWEKVGGWFNYASIYNYFVSRALSGDIIVECGVWKGRSLIYLADIARLSGRGLKIFGIDAWKNDEEQIYRDLRAQDVRAGDSRTVYQQCLDNLAACGFRAGVELIQSDAIVAARFFDDASVSALWLDDSHTHAHMRAEIAAWLPKLGPGAIIGGHDYRLVYEGVKYHFPPERIDQIGTSWLVHLNDLRPAKAPQPGT